MTALPNRRETRTVTFSWKGETYHISLGYRPEWTETGDTVKSLPIVVPKLGPVVEVWARGPKPGSDGWALLQDIAHSMSKELQAGVPPERIAARAMRGANGEPLSLFGVLAHALCGNHP